MLTTALQTLRTRFTLFTGTFIALSLGVALIAGTGQVLDATRRQSAPVTGWYDAADVVVRAPQSYSVRFGRGDGAYDETRTGTRVHRLADAEETVRRIEAVPGVDQVVVDRSVPARLSGGPAAGDGTETVARGWSSAPPARLRLSEGRAPARSGEVVLAPAPGAEPEARAGDRRVLFTSQGREEVRVVGVAEGLGSADPGGPTTVFLTDPAVRQMSSAPSAADAIAVVAEPGLAAATLADRIRAALPDSTITVRTGAGKESGTAGARRAGALDEVATLLAVMALIGCFVSVFVVAGTFAFSVAQRRRELALLRTLGATPSQVTRLVTTEAALLGLVASGVGCALGAQAGDLLVSVLKHYAMAPAGMTVTVSAPVLVISFVTGVVVALAGAFSASRRAAGVRPAETLREADVESGVMTRGRWIAGGFCSAVAVLLLLQLPRAGSDGAVVVSLLLTMVLVVVLTAFAPLLVPPLVWAAARPLAAFTRSTGALAADNARAAVRRTASCAAPILVAVAVAGALIGMSNATSATAVADERAHLRADIVVEGPGEVGVPAVAVRELDGVPGVRGSVPVATTTGHLVGSSALIPAGIGAVDPGGLSDGFRLRTAEGSMDDLRGATVAVSRTLADQAGWHSGEEVRLRLSDTTELELTVTAVLKSTAGLPGVLLPRDTLLSADPGISVGRVYLTLAGDADPGDATRRAAAVARAYGAEALGRAAWLDRSAEAAEREGRVLVLVLLGMALAYTAVAIANTLVMAAEQRASVVLLMRRLGATGGQVVRSVLWETLTVVAVGGVLGSAAAGVTVLGLGRASAEAGDGAVLPVPWSETRVVLGSCLVVAVTASLVPTLIQLRVTRIPRPAPDRRLLRARRGGAQASRR
ncbi:ABC transporter permease [Streptomyces sp. Vc74B-19]|uniref:ABC transporter permease n=1 Tax=unclassified Streptomyces TaxID=2593676 RepID=UPI001BFC1919|nr:MULTISPECIES: ABC transporter permease [unclassified Streptomyces]MBT3166960.1 ABC transporter permease [Streptomyces sp. Vc74B-19]